MDSEYQPTADTSGVRVVLIRHGARGKSTSESEASLTARGIHQVASLCAALGGRGTHPDLFLTSRRQPAIQTAEQLRTQLSNDAATAEVKALTPGDLPAGLDHTLEQARRNGLPVDESRCIAMVGHEGRLSDLLAEMTSRRSRPFSEASVACVRAASLSELLKGSGQIEYRWPVVDHQEEQLRPKVTSKMTVATLLGGFVFAALITVLVDSRPSWEWHRIVAALLLTSSLALFVASVYLFDQLSMPEGFWTDADRPGYLSGLYAWQERRAANRWCRARERLGLNQADDQEKADIQNGPLYRWMLQVSKWVFNPAVLLALGGFTLLLLGTDQIVVQVGGVVAVIAVAGYTLLHRPDLGRD